MNLKSLSDGDLVFRTQELVKQERKTITEVLWHLREIERRMIYAQHGYSSLIEYCIKELHYSEGSAYRRVQAMRILREVPEVEKKLQSGELNLTHLTQAQKFFRESKKEGERPSLKQKREVLHSLQNLSKREAEKTLAEINPSLNLSAAAESERYLKGNRVELTVVLNAELQEKLEEIEILLGKRCSKAELIAFMAERTLCQLKRKVNQRKNPTPTKGSAVLEPAGPVTEEIRKPKAPSPVTKQVRPLNGRPSCVAEQVGPLKGQPTQITKPIRQLDGQNFEVTEPIRQPKGHTARMAHSSVNSPYGEISQASNQIKMEGQLTKALAHPTKELPVAETTGRSAQPPAKGKIVPPQLETLRVLKKRKAIPKPVARAVRGRDQRRCQYRDPVSGRQCEARFYLEIDHKLSHGKGGGDELENLQLLCRSHNALRAVQEFGPQWMQKFMPALK